MTTTTITATEAAVLLQAVLERRGWVFSLNARGQLTLVVGDDLPGLRQDVLMAALGALAPQYEALLAVTTIQ